MSTRTSFILHPSSLILLLVLGCGKPDYQLAPVSGRVTLDGDPIAEVHVMFEPLAVKGINPNPGPNSVAVTDADGRYRLETIDPKEEGAVVGRHRVRLTLEYVHDGRIEDFSPTDKVLPPCCRDGTLEFDVPASGTRDANWDLSSQ